jgi:gas vesicle protein
MGRFIKGMFVGAGIALLVAPMRGVEMRALLRERLIELRKAMPEKEQRDEFGRQLNSYGKQISSQVQRTTQTVRDLTKRSAKKARRTGQDVVGTLKEGAKSSAHTASSKSAHTRAGAND